MAVVAQLVERWLVVPDVAGSSPVGRPSSGGVPVNSTGTTPSLSEDTSTVVSPDVPWVTIVWNDPVNLMSYVTHVFRTYFGFPRAEAERRMMQVHRDGRAVVATGPREEMERHTEAMHEYGLWATVAKASDG
jgi:ATP-dependent Clp protease adaptor protein ClpS